MGIGDWGLGELAGDVAWSPKPLECDLTERQVDVLRGVALGLTNRQIAFALGLRPQTVRNHLSRIYDKLLPDRSGGERGRKYRLQALLQAWRHGALESDLIGGSGDGNGKF